MKRAVALLAQILPDKQLFSKHPLFLTNTVPKKSGWDMSLRVVLQFFFVFFWFSFFFWLPSPRVVFSCVLLYFFGILSDQCQGCGQSFGCWEFCVVTFSCIFFTLHDSTPPHHPFCLFNTTYYSHYVWTRKSQIVFFVFVLRSNAWWCFSQNQTINFFLWGWKRVPSDFPRISTNSLIYITVGFPKLFFAFKRKATKEFFACLVFVQTEFECTCIGDVFCTRSLKDIEILL